jgi:hypothetical protein
LSLVSRIPTVTLVSAALGCTFTIHDTPGETSSGSTTGGPDSTTDEPGTTAEPLPGTNTTAETPTTGEPQTTGTTGTTGTSTTGETDTGPVEPQWCNGFDPVTPGLTVRNNADQEIVDGATLAAECGGQGSLMVAIFPHFGGFMPDSDAVAFDVVLDVEGFNLNPGGHFFSTAKHSHQINCAQEHDTYYGGYSYSFIPMFPPDAIPDINAIDGKPGHLHLTLHAPDGEQQFDADVVMAADIDQCGY